MKNEICFGTSLYDYLEPFSRGVEERRTAELSAIHTKEQAEAMVAKVRQSLRHILGPMDFPRGNSAPQVTGTLHKNGIRIDKVIIEPRKGIFTTGFFMRPETVTDRIPGVLAPCGHSMDGKLCDAYQTFAINLARKGFGVFLFDPPGQGESHQLRPPLSATHEHSMMGRLLRSCGVVTAAVFIHDAQRAIDYLLSRPEVRQDGVAVTGNSGGGQMTYYLHALDDRVTISVASCHMNTLRSLFQTEIATDAESSIENLLAEGRDRPDFGIAGAPKPILFLGAERDFINPETLKKAVWEINQVYKALGAEDKLSLHIFPGPHGYGQLQRRKMYAYFTEHFFGRADDSEPETELITPEEGQVTPTGYAIDLPGATNETTYALTYLVPQNKTGRIAEFLQDSLGMGSALPPAPEYRTLRGRELIPDKAVLRYALITEPGTTVTPVLFTPGTENAPLIPRAPKGRLIVAHLSAIEELTPLAQEDAIFALDVRGIGCSRPISGSGANYDFFATVNNETFMEVTAAMLGRPLVLGKIKDVLAAVALLKANGYDDLQLEGRGMGGLLAAYAAAAFHLPISRLVLEQVPESMEKMTKSGLFRCPNSCIVPGMLRHFDFPQLYQFLAKQYGTQITTADDVPEK